jgi:hypothetical protein
VRARIPLKSKKKNVLFFKIGPPAVPPKSLRVRCGCEAGGVGEKRVGVQTLLRKNSNSSP